MKEYMIEFLNNNSGVLMLIFTAMVAISTVVLCLSYLEISF